MSQSIRASCLPVCSTFCHWRAMWTCSNTSCTYHGLSTSKREGFLLSVLHVDRSSTISLPISTETPTCVETKVSQLAVMCHGRGLFE